jgi:hypothetical protein
MPGLSPIASHPIAGRPVPFVGGSGPNLADLIARQSSMAVFQTALRAALRANVNADPLQNVSLALLANVPPGQAPFVPREWAVRIRQIVRAQDLDENLLLNTLSTLAAAPFVPTHWAARIQRVLQAQTPDQNLLLNTLSAVAVAPFVPREWAVRIQRVLRSQSPDTNLLQNTLAVAPALPFVPVSWQSRASWPPVPRLGGAVGELAHNLLLTTLAQTTSPFVPQQWERLVGRRAARSSTVQSNLLLNTLAAAPVKPLVPTMWEQRVRVPSRSLSAGANELLTILFAQAPAQLPLSSYVWVVVHVAPNVSRSLSATRQTDVSLKATVSTAPRTLSVTPTTASALRVTTELHRDLTV